MPLPTPEIACTVQRNQNKGAPAVGGLLKKVSLLLRRGSQSRQLLQVLIGEGIHVCRKGVGIIW